MNTSRSCLFSRVSVKNKHERKSTTSPIHSKTPPYHRRSRLQNPYSTAKQDYNRYISIDLGLDNFATIVNNVGKQPIVINGKGLKSVNQYYNKQMSHYRKVAKQMNGLDWTKRMSKMTEKRNRIVENFMHQASAFVMKHALSLDCDTIVVGMNKDWKREVHLGKRTNQAFVHIPYQTFLHQLQYKAKQHGIRVIVTEESYTSKCSF